VALLAEVLRPALAAAPATLAFGVLRASAGGPPAGGGARVLQIFLTNATPVPAAWSIRHVPAPPPSGAAAPAARAAAGQHRRRRLLGGGVGDVGDAGRTLFGAVVVLVDDDDLARGRACSLHFF
jgi:hypothetical protein